MEINKLAKVLFLSSAAVVFAACSSTGSNTSDQSGSNVPATEVGQGVSTQGTNEQELSGVGEDQKQLLEQNTYRFAYDSSRLDDQSKVSLDAHAQFLNTVGKDRKLIIEGYTDERGSAEYNLALGEHRAKAVELYLQAKGVNPKQMEVVSYGEANPVDPASNPSAWAKNRRAVLDLLPAN